MKQQPDLVVLRVAHAALIAANKELPEPSYNIGQVVTMIEGIILNLTRPPASAPASAPIEVMICLGLLNRGQQDWAELYLKRDPVAFWEFIFTTKMKRRD